MAAVSSYTRQVNRTESDVMHAAITFRSLIEHLTSEERGERRGGSRADLS